MIIPNVFATNKEKFMERFNKVVGLTEWVQIDFMDGEFVPAISLSPKEMPDLHKQKTKFEAHLMVKDPHYYIEQLKKEGFSKVIVHIEAYEVKERLNETVMDIKLAGMIPGISLNPETSLEKLYPYLTEVRHVQFMGIHPGAEGRSFIEEVYDKISHLRSKDPELSIQVDGGVNLETAPLLAKAGCDHLNTGSFVGDAKNPKKAIKELEHAFYNGLNGN